MNGLKELRRHERHRLRGQIELSWGIPGGKISAAISGNCLDVSVYGMLVESPSPIPAGAKVTAKLLGSGISGEAMVRHCKQYGPWFCRLRTQTSTWVR